MARSLLVLLVAALAAGCMGEGGRENGLIAASSDRGIELLEADGTLVRILPGTKQAGSVAWSPDGKLIAYAAGDTLYTIRRDGSARRVIAENATEPSWSPDGEQLAFMRDVCEARRDAEACTLELDNPYDLFVVDADGGHPRRLSSSTDYDGLPAWSPDGDRIAFECGNFRLCLMRSDGSERRRLAGHFQWPAWTHDGEGLLGASYTGDARAGYDLVRVDPDTGARKRIAQRWGMDFAPAPSPDGTQLAFLANTRCLRTGECTAHEPWEVWVMAADGSKARRITRGGYGPPAWAPR